MLNKEQKGLGVSPRGQLPMIKKHYCCLAGLIGLSAWQDSEGFLVLQLSYSKELASIHSESILGVRKDLVSFFNKRPTTYC